MSFPRPVPETKLEAMRKAEEERIKRWQEVNYDPANHVAASVDRRQRQERFLEVFAKCLSPKLACKQSGVSMAAYRKWRRTSTWFAEQLNGVMEEWEHEAQASIAGRIIGYTVEDSETESGLKEDASGKVRYFDASDSLGRQYVDHHQRALSPDKQGVTIEINFDAFTGRQLDDSAVEAEFIEVNADSRIPTHDPDTER